MTLAAWTQHFQIGGLLGQARIRHAESVLTVLVATAITTSSAVLMLLCASPEFSWDEAYRIPYTADSWRQLWSSYTVSHGPMVYLAKLGQQLVPAGLASLEVRSRFFAALVASASVGLVYSSLRHGFRTSRVGALVGATLLLLSVIRLQETNVIGPQHLILGVAVAMLGLGYRWRKEPTLRAAISLGALVALGALSTTYIIPVALCWGLAISIAAKKWIDWRPSHLRVSPYLPVVLLPAATIFTALSPAGFFKRAFLDEFLFYLRFSGHTALVGDQIFEVGPWWAFAYWLVAWNAIEMPWTTRADAAIPDQVKYVLIPEFVYKNMPAQQTMRRVVAAHWKPVWSYKATQAWELRLYERP